MGTVKVRRGPPGPERQLKYEDVRLNTAFRGKVGQVQGVFIRTPNRCVVVSTEQAGVAWLGDSWSDTDLRRLDVTVEELLDLEITYRTAVSR